MATGKEPARRLEKIVKNKAAAYRTESAEAKGASITPPVFLSGNTSSNKEPIQMSPLKCNITKGWYHSNVEESGCLGIDTAGMHKVNKGKKGNEVVVAVIDTEVDVKHEDFEGGIWERPEGVKDANISNEQSLAVNSGNYGHGTKTAGIIAAKRGNGKGIDGIADNVQIMPISAYKLSIAKSITYAVDNGAQVINMSMCGKNLTSQEERDINEAVKYAEKHDVLIVRSAGNDSENIDEEKIYPRDRFGEFDDKEFENVNNLLVVGASVKEIDKRTLDDFKQIVAQDKLSGFDEETALFWSNLMYEERQKSILKKNSNRGKYEVDVLAPGIDGKTTYPGSNKYTGENYLIGQTYRKYENYRDTSMAAAVVSGIAAEIRSHYPDLSAAQVKEIIMKSVHKLDVGENSVPMDKLSRSGGIVNARKAMELAKRTKGNANKKNRKFGLETGNRFFEK